MVKNVKIYLKISNFYYLEIKKKFPAEEKEDDEFLSIFLAKRFLVFSSLPKLRVSLSSAFQFRTTIIAFS